MSEDDIRNLMMPLLQQAKAAGVTETINALKTARTFAALPPPPPSPPASPYPPSQARYFSDYFEPNARGDYPANMHEQFGMGRKGFALATGLKMRGGRFRWFDPDAEPPVETFADAPADDYTTDEIVAAALDAAEEAAEAGEDPADVLAALSERLGGVSAFSAGFDESKHPRDRGKFATKSGAKGAAKPPGKREQKLKARAASKAKATDLLNARASGKPVSHSQAKELLSHMGNLTHSDLTELRRQFATTFRGARVKAGRVDALVSWAKGEAYTRRRGRQGSALQRVVDFGGIDPQSADFKRFYGSVKDAVNDGIPLAAFKRGGEGLDRIAQQMKSAGDLGDHHDPSEKVVELLRGRRAVESTESDADDEYAKYVRDHYDADGNTGTYVPDDNLWDDEEPVHFADPPQPLGHPDHYLAALASPEHAATRAGGDHPDADHQFRGEAADALQEHGRNYEAGILRDRDRHVTVSGGRVTPARYTLQHVRKALGGAPVGLGVSWPGSEGVRLTPGDQPFAVVHAPKAVPAVVHASQVPGALADRLARVYQSPNPDNPLTDTSQRAVDALRSAPVEEPDAATIHEYGLKPNWRRHGAPGEPTLGAELEVSTAPRPTAEQQAREEAVQRAQREANAAYDDWRRLARASDPAMREAVERARAERDAALTAWNQSRVGGDAGDQELLRRYWQAHDRAAEAARPSPEEAAARQRYDDLNRSTWALPQRGPRGTPRNQPFFGTREHLRLAARQTLDKLNAGLPKEGFAFLKADGSINQGVGPEAVSASEKKGFEIVTHPATLDVHKQRWPAVLGANNEAGLLSNSAKYNTGLHVHVGRDALTPLGVHKILQFVNTPANKEYVEAVARRPLGEGNRWAQLKPGVKPSDALGSGGTRYEAVNLKNPGTVEFRIFGGTLDPAEFFTSLEFADAMAHFARAGSTGATDATTAEPFLRWVGSNRKRYPHLDAFNRRFAAAKGIPTNFADEWPGDGLPPIPLAVSLSFEHPDAADAQTFAEGTNHEALAAGLNMLASPAHGRTRAGGNDPSADHTFRGRLADLLQDHGRDREAGLLRSRDRHVIVHQGRVVPARYTTAHVERAYNHAVDHLQDMTPNLLYESDDGFEPLRPGSHHVEYHTSEGGPGVAQRARTVHVSDLPHAVGYYLRANANRRLRALGADPAMRAEMEPELERRLAAVRSAPFEEPLPTATPATPLPDGIDHNAHARHRSFAEPSAPAVPNLRDKLITDAAPGPDPTPGELRDRKRNSAAAWAEARARNKPTAATKATRAANRFRDVARRRRVLAAYKAEGELAAGMGAHHLPDSEPGDVIHITDPAGKVITDPDHVRQALKVRRRMVERLDDPNLLPHEREFLEGALEQPVHVFEVKTLQTSARNYVQVNPKALAKKQAFADAHRANFHTVAVDRRRGKKASGHAVYVAPYSVAPTTNLASMTKAATMAAVLDHVRSAGRPT